MWVALTAIAGVLALVIAWLQWRSGTVSATVQIMTLVIEDLMSAEAKEESVAIDERKQFLEYHSLAHYEATIGRCIGRMDKVGYLLLECANVREKPSLRYPNCVRTVLDWLFVRKEPPTWIWERTNRMWQGTLEAVLERRNQEHWSQFGVNFERLANAARQCGRLPASTDTSPTTPDKPVRVRLLPLKPFSLGTLFFFFALALFGIESPSLTVQLVRLGLLVLSTCLLLMIVGKSLLREAWISRLAGIRNRLPQWAEPVCWMFLWPLTVTAYYLGHTIALGDGLSGIQRNPAGVSLEVIGIVWLFVIVMLLFAQMIASLDAVSRYLKPVMLSLSTPLIVYGAFHTATASSFDERLTGLYFIALALAISLASIHWRSLSAEL